MTTTQTEQIIDLSTLDTPVLTGDQVQGDVFFAADDRMHQPGKPIPAEGIVLVSGEGGHTHMLLPSQGVTFLRLQDPRTPGIMHVDKDCVATVHHMEHGYMAFGPGSYIVTRQMEQTDVQRLVAD